MCEIYLVWLTYEGDLTLSTGTCFIQKIYAPSSSLLNLIKEEEGAYIFKEEEGAYIFKEEEGAYIFWMKQVPVDNVRSPS